MELYEPWAGSGFRCHVSHAGTAISRHRPVFLSVCVWMLMTTSNGGSLCIPLCGLPRAVRLFTVFWLTSLMMLSLECDVATHLQQRSATCVTVTITPYPAEAGPSLTQQSTTSSTDIFNPPARSTTCSLPPSNPLAHIRVAHPLRRRQVPPTAGVNSKSRHPTLPLRFLRNDAWRLASSAGRHQ